MTLTASQLCSVMPHLAPLRAAGLIDHLNAAMAEADISTPARICAFLAQVAHESGELRYFEEQASGKAYEGRKDLGNVEPGDGARFKGRGPIQLTGRKNYALASVALQEDLLRHPERVADPDMGFRTTAWFWRHNGLNELADAGDFESITRRINGGLNGLEQRRAYLARAIEALTPKEKA